MKKLAFALAVASTALAVSAAVPYKLGIAGYTFCKKNLDESLAIMKAIDCHYLCIKDFHLGYGADAATVNPYMGFDAVKPFLDTPGKGVFVLCRTSNPSAVDLQNLVAAGAPLYEHVAGLVRDKWNSDGNAGLVIGATAPEELRRLRGLCPGLWFLVPGVGAQGGDVEKVTKFGCDASGYGIAVNSSRGIIYASKGPDFAEAARAAAGALRDTINSFRSVK